MKNIIELLEKNLNEEKQGVCDSRFFSYKEILLQAKKVASFFIEKGIYNRPIAVLADQNVNTLIMMFGVVYSGNYYVLIDPLSPLSRLKRMLAEIDNCVGSTNLFAGGGSTAFVKFDDAVKQDINEQAIKKIENTIDENQILYLVYTSGSTGVPKAVAKSHGSMISFVENFNKKFSIKNNEVLANQTPFYFDASAKDIYLSLFSSCTLKIVPKALFSFPAKLIEFLNNEKITTIFWVPSALSIIAQLKTFKFIKPTSLRKVFFVGEVFPTKYINYWLENVPEIKMVNLYGCSETAGVVCYYEVDKIMDINQNLPIGKPFENCFTFLLKDGGSEVTHADVEGELCIGGRQLAEGYYNDEQRTQQSFVYFPNLSYQSKVYKTGDIAKYDKQGNLVFVTRKDFQIKHMGHRIELGEIETAVNALEEIGNCCAVYNSERKKIVLVYTLNDSKNIALSELSDKLKEFLPDYMLPNIMKLAEAMPKNKNGKIDREKIKQDVLGG